MIRKTFGILLITICGNCFASSEIVSHYGVFKVIDKNQVVFSDQPLNLESDEIREIDLVEIFRFPDHDIILVKKKANDACPITFNLIVVSESGANVTESFGTCLDLLQAHQNENSVVITIPRKNDAQYLEITYTNDFPTKPSQKIIKPRRKFVSSRVKDYDLSKYVENWQHLLDDKFSEVASLKSILLTGEYEAVQLIVSINSDGSIYSIETSKSSGNIQLDQAVTSFVEQSSPFEKFPEEILKEADILSIVRTFKFTHERIN